MTMKETPFLTMQILYNQFFGHHNLDRTGAFPTYNFFPNHAKFAPPRQLGTPRLFDQKKNCTSTLIREPRLLGSLEYAFLKSKQKLAFPAKNRC